ncbi:MAG TPA: hypothetical protein VK141_08055 [Nitrosomonas sp.]|nr:hypothetical protein [Nitrosomonas sp.]
MLGESTVKWSLTISMLRDLKTKPLPSNCGTGETIGIYPSREDIDHYLKPVSMDRKGHGIQQKSVESWLKQRQKHDND